MITAQSSSSNTMLVMTSSTRTCNLLTEFLSSMDQDAPPGSRGRPMMLRKLRAYLWWKGRMDEKKPGDKNPSAMPDNNNTGKDIFDAIFADQEGVSEALKKKDKEKAQRAQNRRRIRGGAPAASSSPVKGQGSAAARLEPQEVPVPKTMQNDTDEFAKLYVISMRSMSGQILMWPLQLSQLGISRRSHSRWATANYGRRIRILRFWIRRSRK